ncbi:hypothetical protein EB796_003887 [Bugula neritina]|uniref:Uncharacterized protein n=1 Tax=Bugula neritina TaxID=10212 RepID=A0A7J7KIS9_BUGNE|nr:hypothetical protein EB796_003887 [Bugula neritina]
MQPKISLNKLTNRNVTGSYVRSFTHLESSYHMSCLIFSVVRRVFGSVASVVVSPVVGFVTVVTPVVAVVSPVARWPVASVAVVVVVGSSDKGEADSQ